MASWTRRLWQDESGVILPYVTVMLVVFVGVGALALDGARYMSLQTQLQEGADAAALAGAEELDRLTTSTARATNAINNLVSNSSLFAGRVTISSIRFLSSLPASDASAIAAANVTCSTACTTAQSVASRFVEVTVTPVTMPTILPVSFVKETMGNIAEGASAVAGNDEVNCGLTPIFICNPFEQSGDTYDQATGRLETANDPNSTFRHQLMRLADNSNGASGTWGPGDFGYLVPEPGTLPPDPGHCFSSSGSGIGVAMAAAKPNVCVRQNGVDFLTGNTTDAINGLNTRFGQYGSNSPDPACISAFPPDTNVRTGYKLGSGASASWCNAGPTGSVTGTNPQWPADPDKSGFPADPCLRSTTGCSPVANLGSTTWDCASYWTATQATGTAMPPGCADGSATRNSVYQYEIDNSLLGHASANGETGTPLCPGTTPTSSRRVLHVAIVNCQALGPTVIKSNAQNVPVAAFGKFFLTNATPTSGQTKPYAEFLGLEDRGGGLVYDQVQLYR